MGAGEESQGMKALRKFTAFTGALVLATIGLADVAGGGLVLVSKSSTGELSNSYSDSPNMTRDGRFVTYTSSATNLNSTPPGYVAQLYVLDRTNGATETVSVSSAGDPADNNANFGSLSDDGSVVAFVSTATNLTDDRCSLDNDEDCQGVFARNRTANTTVQVSKSWNGDPTDGQSGEAVDITADGRYVVFSSGASNLVPDDTNGRIDVFVRDLVTETTERISVDATGAEANGVSADPMVTADGRFVTFWSTATNLAPGGSAAGAIYVVDRVLGTIEARGGDGNQAGSYDPTISDDGEILTYLSYSTLLPGDTNPSYDLYLEHRSTGARELVNADSGGVIGINSDNARVSADGTEVLFRSGAVLVPDAGTGMGHLYLRRVADGALTLVSRADDGRSIPAPGGGFRRPMSSDARFVAFSTYDATAVPNDTNGNYDVYVRDLGAPAESATGTGTADTDGEADGATYLDPVETTVVGPPGAAVSISEVTANQPLPVGFTALGQQAEIHVTPGGTVADPIVLTFRFDASLLPVGADASSVHLFRNGVEVAACSGAPSAVPDPCISDRSVLGDGDVQITARSSAASAWNGAIEAPVDTTAPQIYASTPWNNAVLVQNQVVHAQYVCSDDFGPGGLSCVGDVVSGAPIDTSVVGTHTFGITASDAAGNTANVSISYSVVADEFIWIGSTTVVEGDSANPRVASFPVTLDHPADRIVTVHWSTNEGSALAGEDFTTRSGKVTFKPSVRTGVTTTTKFINIPIAGDADDEPDEYFTVGLDTPTGGYQIGASTAYGVIANDDTTTGLRVGIGDASVWEGDVATVNPAKVWITLSSPVPGTTPISVRLTAALAGTTSGVDHRTFRDRTIVFKPGQWRKAVSLAVLADTVQDGGEGVTLTLSDPSPGLAISRGNGMFTINDDD